MNSITFTDETYRECFRNLFEDTSRDGMNILFAGAAETYCGVEFLVKHMWRVELKDRKRQGNTHLSLEPRVYRRALEFAEEANLGIILCRSHRCGDDQYECGLTLGERDLGELKKYRNEKLDTPFVSVIWGPTWIFAWMFDSGKGQFVLLDAMKIVSLTKGIQRLSLGEAERTRRVPLPSKRFHRQVLAFGEEGQQRVQGISVAIVGTSSLGFPTAIELVKLGVKKIVLIDPDEISSENLNRLTATGPADIGKKKAEVLARIIRHMASDVEVIALTVSADAPEAIEQLKQVYVIFGCIDTESGRTFLTLFCAIYLKSYVDCGCGILPGEEKKVEFAGGQVRIFIPGQTPCLECMQGIDKKRVIEETMSEEERAEARQRGYIQGVDLPNPSVGSLCTTVAALGVSEFMLWVTGLRPPRQYLHYDLLAARALSIEARINPDCIICSPGGLLGAGDGRSLPDMSGHRPLDPPPRVREHRPIQQPITRGLS